MGFIVNSKDGLMDLSTGRKWANGRPIGPGAVSPTIWQTWLESGVVREEAEKVAPPPPALVDLPGMTEPLLAALAEAGVEDIAGLLATADEALLSISGIGQATLKKWHGALK